MLTVIVLAYNHETTLAAALDSILTQKTTYRYQIWLCEDHSTDRTLEVCADYAARYPDRVTLMAQPTNTGVLHLRAALCKVTTPYLTILDGDDYWCDEQKIQLALDTLEQHREYATFAHDTWYDDAQAKARKSLAQDINKSATEQRYDLRTAPYHHMSARVHRNVVDFNRVPAGVKIFDLQLFYLYLDKGPLYSAGRIMSVYNITGMGMWSKLADAKRKKNQALAYFSSNWLLGYRYDSFFTSKIRGRALRGVKKLLGNKLGWNVYMLAMYRTRRL